MIKFENIPISLIKPDPNQPRKFFDENSIAHLAESLKTEGIIHPPEVDKDYVIIVGELRYRAARLLGWETMPVNVNDAPLTPYERLRRQMAENLQQSGAKGGGHSMNVIDTARAWVRLYELLTGKSYQANQYDAKRDSSGRFLPGPLQEIAKEVGVSHDTVWQYVKFLSEPKFVIEDILKGRSSTYYREAQYAPPELREEIQKKIAAGGYDSKHAVRQEVQILKNLPELADTGLIKRTAKFSFSSNRIMDGVTRLALALKDGPLGEVNEAEKGLVVSNLKWLQSKIEEYLG